MPFKEEKEDPGEGPAEAGGGCRVNSGLDAGPGLRREEAGTCSGPSPARMET